MLADSPQVVVLAAGQGLRLRKGDHDYLKPLYPLAGRPLIGRVMDNFCAHGARDFVVVVGFEKEELMHGIEQVRPSGASVRFVENQQWQLSNGVSLLTARPWVRGRFYLTMSDHLFQREMLATLARGAGEPDCLYLAVDHKLDTIFDMEDATKVQTDGGRILDIGKGLTPFDAVDTGLFLCPSSLFDCLERARAARGGDCSLSDGVRCMAREAKAKTVGIAGARWQDVDTARMLAHAETLLADGWDQSGEPP
jgi:1L-myo-inositol 1-phosphate cytidylyltransferase